MEVSDEQFSQLIGQALDELPEKYTKNMKNVAIVYEDQPSPEQRRQLQLRGDQSLYGLYQGIPLPVRSSGYNLVLPDKITIFKGPMTASSYDLADLKAKVKHTVWHEIAHHFGLNHDRIHELEDNHRPSDHTD